MELCPTTRTATAMRSPDTATREYPRLPQLEKSLHSNEDPAQPNKERNVKIWYIHRIKYHSVLIFRTIWLPGWLSGKESACNVGDIADAVSIPGLGRFPREGDENPLQYSCPGGPVDIGAWRATFHGVAKSWTWLSESNTHTHKLYTKTMESPQWDIALHWLV